MAEKEIQKCMLVDNYRMHLHAIQNLSSKWHFVIEFYPIDKDSQFAEPIMVPGHSVFICYEYALEAAIEVLESFGFLMAGNTVFDVYEINQPTVGYTKKLVEFDNEVFKVIKKVDISSEDYFSKFHGDNNPEPLDGPVL